MKLNNDRIIEIYIKTSYLYWFGLISAGTLIMLVANDIVDVKTIALNMGMFVFFALVCFVFSYEACGVRQNV